MPERGRFKICGNTYLKKHLSELDEQVTMGWVLHRLQALAAPLPVHPAEDIVPLLRSLPKG